MDDVKMHVESMRAVPHVVVADFAYPQTDLAIFGGALSHQSPKLLQGNRELSLVLFLYLSASLSHAPPPTHAGLLST